MNDFLIYLMSSIIKPEDSYVTENLHLRFLSNFMHFRSETKLGKKKLAKLFNLQTSTIRRWIETIIEITKPEETEELIILQYRLKEKAHTICHQLNDDMEFDFNILSEPSPNDFTNTEGNYLCLESREWDSYDDWDLKEWYSEELFDYLLNYIHYLRDLSIEHAILEIDSPEGNKEERETV